MRLYSVSCVGELVSVRRIIETPSPLFARNTTDCRLFLFDSYFAFRVKNVIRFLFVCFFLPCLFSRSMKRTLEKDMRLVHSAQVFDAAGELLDTGAMKQTPSPVIVDAIKQELFLLDLPRDLLQMQLLPFLGDDAVSLANLAQTCRYFRDMAFGLVRTLKLHTHENLSAVLDRMPNLTSLTLIFPQRDELEIEETNGVLASLAKLSKLRVLDLRESTVSITDPVIEAMPNLEELYLNSSPSFSFWETPKVKPAKYSIAVLAGLKNLRVLCNVQVVTDDARHALAKLTGLKKLSFSLNSRIKGSDLLALTQLQELDLFYATITKDLVLPSTLRSLVLPMSPWEGAPSLDGLINLEYLDLASLGNSYAEADLFALPKLRAVRGLYKDPNWTYLH